jgi:hypothetical protein
MTSQAKRIIMKFSNDNLAHVTGSIHFLHNTVFKKPYTNEVELTEYMS